MSQEKISISVSLNEKHKKINVVGEGLSSETIQQLLTGVLGYFKNDLESNNHTHQLSSTTKETMPSISLESKNTPPLLITRPKVISTPKETEKPKIKKPALIGSERTSTPLGELMGEKLAGISFTEEIAVTTQEETAEEVPDFYVTGIKYKEIGSHRIPHYKLHLCCPDCESSERHYVALERKSINCYQCKSKLMIEAATPHGIGATEKYRDEQGNFLIANKKV